MSKLFVPACGDRITLAKPWDFTLILESRNLQFAESNGIDIKQFKNTGWAWQNPLDSLTFTMKAGTVLECDRVYIRSTSKSADTVADSYDSITWKVVVNGKAAKKQRFWVKLYDCYSLEFDPTSISRYQDRKNA